MEKYEVATQSEIVEFVKENRNWSYESEKLVGEYVFQDFSKAMEVINEVAELAETLDHHPAWSNEYNRVSFKLCTHEADNQVTNLDLKLAEAIELVVQQ